MVNQIYFKFKEKWQEKKNTHTKKPNQSLVTLLPTGHQIFLDILSIQDTGRTIVQHFRNTERILHHFCGDVNFWDSCIKGKKKVIPKWTWTEIHSDGIKTLVSKSTGKSSVCQASSSQSPNSQRTLTGAIRASQVEDSWIAKHSHDDEKSNQQPLRAKK